MVNEIGEQADDGADAEGRLLLELHGDGGKELRKPRVLGVLGGRAVIGLDEPAGERLEGGEAAGED